MDYSALDNATVRELLAEAETVSRILETAIAKQDSDLADLLEDIIGFEADCVNLTV